MTSFDVYSYGMISTSTLHVLNSSFPEPDAYAEIKNTYSMIGGEAANSSIVLSKLGVNVKLDGNWLGKNEKGFQTVNILKDFKIDTERLTLKADYRGVEEIVFADGNRRTIFGTYCNLLFTTKQWNEPVKEDIINAEVVCLDPFFKEESLFIAKICEELKKPYVTIDCTYTDEIAKNAEVIIISGEFRKREYRNVDIEKLFQSYTGEAKGLVVFTAGSSNILYGRAGEGIKRFTPYKIEPIDTAGAGDSFRSGVIYGLLKKWPEEKFISFASALGAYICESFPGVLNAPSYIELIDHIERKGWVI
ncbi:MAG: carbohydrate kinase family protein [Bacteroidota bacterium]